MDLENANKKTVNNLKEFYLSYTDKFYDDVGIRKNMFSGEYILKNYGYKKNKNVFKKILCLYLEEAELTIKLLEKTKVSKNSTILEIGGGLGFVYGFLKKKGYKIYSIEPSAASYDGRYDIALKIFSIIKVDPSCWFPLTAEDSPKLKRKFDIIISNNVLEHIKNLDLTFKSMKSILKEKGVMYHNTINYIIPYEPHFSIFLVPFFPNLTKFFKPKLKDSSLWGGLNFVTSIKIKKLCKKYYLKVKFQNGVLYESFERLGKDKEFAKRQRYFVAIYKFLKKTRTLNLLKLVPPTIATPIQFTIIKDE